MENLLVILFVAAFTGLVASIIALYNLLSSKKQQKHVVRDR
jgi:type IV secretory pathway component VirB8